MSDGQMVPNSVVNAPQSTDDSLQQSKMTGDLNLEAVYQAIQTLYSEQPNVAAADKHNASEFLNQFQRSMQAWSFADQLLYHGPDLNTRYFGAHTLRTKIQSSFHELPQESYSALRDSLVQHVKNINGRTETSIVNQLCLAVTYLVLQATNWADPIGQLLNSLGPDVKCWWPLLEILIFIPEEAYSRKLHLGENRRHQIMTQLEGVAHAVLDFSKQCLRAYTNGALAESNVNTETLLVCLLNCFKAWVQVSPEIFCTDQPGEVLGFAVAQLQSGRCPLPIHEAATECITAVVYDLPDPDKAGNNNVIDLHSMQQALFQSIMSFEEAYHLSVAEEDLEKTLNYCRLFTDYAESMISFMVKSWRNPHYSLRAIDLVLICEGHHDYEVAEATFPFWYKLTEVVYHAHDESLNTMFRPYAQRCIQALYKHCYIESDHEGPLDKDDDFYDFRKKVQVLVEDLEFMIGSLQIFRDIGAQLMNPNSGWDSIEAALFLLRPLTKSIDTSDVETVEPVIRTVLSWTEWKHICVRISAVKFIGSMAGWFRKHPEGYLLGAMTFLANSLEFPDTSNPAGAALLNMCQNCAEQVAPNLDSLLGLLEQMDRFNVSNDAVVGLLRGLGHVVGTLPRDKLQIVLKQICSAQLVPLNALAMNNALTVEERDSKGDPTFWVDRLSALFRTTDIDLKDDEEHPCKPVICEDVWPVMSRVCDRFQADPRVMERVCRCLRYAVRCVGKHSHPFVQPLVTQLVQMYSAHHHSCFLYIGSILVDEYGSLDVCVPGLLQMLEAFYTPTFQLLGDTAGLRNHPDTVDDFFRLCVRYIQHCPIPFLGSQVFNNIMQLGLHGINLDHGEANTSVMKFFYELVHQCRKEDAAPNVAAMVKNIFNQYGPNCVYTCLHAAIFNLPTSLLFGICDLLNQLKIYLPTEMSAWLESTLKQLPNKTVSGAPFATLAQLEAFHKQVMGSRSAKEMTRFMKEFCRLYR